MNYCTFSFVSGMSLDAFHVFLDKGPFYSTEILDPTGSNSEYPACRSRATCCNAFHRSIVRSTDFLEITGRVTFCKRNLEDIDEWINAISNWSWKFQSSQNCLKVNRIDRSLRFSEEINQEEYKNFHPVRKTIF